MQAPLYLVQGQQMQFCNRPNESIREADDLLNALAGTESMICPACRVATNPGFPEAHTDECLLNGGKKTPLAGFTPEQGSNPSAVIMLQHHLKTAKNDLAEAQERGDQHMHDTGLLRIQLEDALAKREKAMSTLQTIGHIIEREDDIESWNIVDRVREMQGRIAAIDKYRTAEPQRPDWVPDLKKDAENLENHANLLCDLLANARKERDEAKAAFVSEAEQWTDLRARVDAIDAAKAGEPPMPMEFADSERIRTWGRWGWDAAAALRVDIRDTITGIKKATVEVTAQAREEGHQSERERCIKAIWDSGSPAAEGVRSLVFSLPELSDLLTPR